MNTDSPKKIFEFLTKLKDEKSKLHYHQIIVQKYFLEYDVRGLLVYHGMGSGKTFVAASICEDLVKKKYSVIFISGKSLHENFRRTVLKYNPSVNEKKYTFVSINASNMITQVARASDKIEASINKNVVPNLNRKIVVVDEAHNFFNAIANGSKNAQLLYKAIMKSNCKVLFLSGTPIINDPFEAALCFNMLNGPIKNSTLFPESYQKFNEYFVSMRNGKPAIANINIFIHRIFGLVSHYRQELNNLYPEQRTAIIENCEMSTPQFNEYVEYRKIEQNSIKKTYDKQENLTKKKKSASYRVMTRQVCNFFYPDKAAEFITGEKGQKLKKGQISLLTAEDLDKNLFLYSPKLVRLFANLKQKGVHLVYSQFLNYGLKIIEKLLNFYKIPYAMISGEIAKEKIADIVEQISSEKNAAGDLIKVVLVSSTASEGVSFRNIKYVHILEYYWTESKINQIIARGIRLGSHVNLPENERFVQPYIYIATHKTFMEGESTDEYLLNKAREKQKLINQFLEVLKVAAIDCKIFDEGCFECNIDEVRPLYGKSIDEDIANELYCRKIVENQYFITVDNENYLISYEGEETLIYLEIAEDLFEEILDPKIKEKVLYSLELNQKNKI